MMINIEDVIGELRDKSYVMVGLSSAPAVKSRVASDFSSMEIDNIVCTIHNNRYVIADISKKLPDDILRIFSKTA